MPKPYACAWISCLDQLPPNSCPVLAWEVDCQVPGCVVASYYYLTEKWASTESGCDRGAITHWMPLPNGPGIRAGVVAMVSGPTERVFDRVRREGRRDGLLEAMRLLATLTGETEARRRDTDFNTPEGALRFALEMLRAQEARHA